MPVLNEILTKKALSPVTKLFKVHTPDLARKAQPGEFVVLRVDERGERIPLTIADFDRQRGTITLVVQEVGKTTLQMGAMRIGDRFATLTGPLGQASPVKQYGSVICVGGGSSIAAIYPLARGLKEQGNKVISIIGARCSELIFWDERIRAVSDELIICTDDGSLGQRALVTGPLAEILGAGRHVDHVFAIGPAIMMKNCAQTTLPYGTPTTVSLNAIMIDGTGMCGGCRVEVGGQIRFACVDGPKFDGHQVNWDQFLARQTVYHRHEQEALTLWRQNRQETWPSDNP